MAGDAGSSFLGLASIVLDPESLKIGSIDQHSKSHWIPACAGMTNSSLGAKAPGLWSLLQWAVSC